MRHEETAWAVHTDWSSLRPTLLAALQVSPLCQMRGGVAGVLPGSADPGRNCMA